LPRLVNIPADALWVQFSNEKEFQSWLDALRFDTPAASLTKEDGGPIRFYLVQGRVVGAVIGASPDNSTSSDGIEARPNK